LNIYQVTDDVFRFQLWNLAIASEELYGHYTIWWSRRDGVETPRLVITKHGSYAGLTTFEKVESDLTRPTQGQLVHLLPLVQKALHHAFFYSYEVKDRYGPALLGNEGSRVKTNPVWKIGECSPTATHPADQDAVKLLHPEDQQGEVGYFYMQQGGSTLEWYAACHDSQEAAEEGKAGCDEGAYFTTEIREIPKSLINEEFFELMEAVVSECVENA
jgi:hypothetical protein